MLVALLLSPGQPVLVENLVNRLWDEHPPPKARDDLYTYIARLRRHLHNAVGEDRVQVRSSSGAYVLEADPETIDLHQFRLLRAQARSVVESGDDDDALTLHEQAARLWHGEPLGGISGHWVVRTRKKLEDELLAATFERIEIRLRLGHHADLVGELSELLERYPFVEQFSEYLMLALFRSGRQADAQQLYRDVRMRFVEELGIEAGPSMQELHQQILRGDAGLLYQQRPQSTNNLPRDVRSFTGREEEIRQILAWAAPERPSDRPHGNAATVITLDGMAGVGKTALAVHVAHQLSDRYPDGTIFLDLRGHHTDQASVEPGDALDALLRLLGLPPGRIPRGYSQRAAFWRSQLAHRRALIVLDDATGHEQIRPLLPGSAGSLVLVTSRRRLTGLDDVWSLSLDVLPSSDAVTLFTRVVGGDRPLDRHDVTKVVQLCGHLPMAVQLVGNRLRDRRAWRVADLIARLDRDSRRLEEIRAEDRQISAAFELSYRELGPLHRQVFRRLALHPGSELTAYAAAAFGPGSAHETERILDDLHDHHLVTEPTPGRFRCHDLVRDYVRRLTLREDSQSERRRLVRRVLDYYLYTADQADRLIYPNRRRIEPEIEDPPPDPVSLSTMEQAREWMRNEHDNLLSAAHHAAEHGWPVHVAFLAHVLAYHLEAGGHWEQAARLHRSAIDAWHQIGDQAGVAQAQSDLSLVCRRSGHYAEALEYGHEALTRFRSAGDQTAEADLLTNIGLIHWNQSRYTEAFTYFESALSLRRALGDRPGEAACLNYTAILLWHTGKYREARGDLQRALAIYRGIGSRDGQTMTLNNIGDVELRLGNTGAAMRNYEEAASVSEMSRQHEAIWFNNVANVYQETGRHEEALTYYRKALETYREIGDRRTEAEVLNSIGSAYLKTGRSGEALIHHTKSRTISVEIGERYTETQALRRLGEVYERTGRYTVAYDHYKKASKLAEQIGDPYEQARALDGIGTALLHIKGHAAAKRHWKNALRLYQRLGVPEADSVRARLRRRDHATGT